MFQISKIQPKMPVPLLNQNITIKSSKHTREIKVPHRSHAALPNIINSYTAMAHCFNNFFCQNILNIHDGFPSSTSPQEMSLVEQSCISVIDIFDPFTETDIRQLLERSSNAFCIVDPMPTWLMIECLAVLISMITKVDKK